jgi:hypothetical protein
MDRLDYLTTAKFRVDGDHTPFVGRHAGARKTDHARDGANHEDGEKAK